MNPRVSVGLEFNPAAEEVTPTANWIIHTETKSTPMISAGTSSDRIFSAPGNQAYYITFAKGIPGTPFSPYIGVSYSEFEDKLLFPMGVNVSLKSDLDFLSMYDGKEWHLLLTKLTPKVNYTLMMVRLSDPTWGISIGFGF